MRSGTQPYYSLNLSAQLTTFQLTLLDQELLIRRLESAFLFLTCQIRTEVLDFKNDPISFSKRVLRSSHQLVCEWLRQPNRWISITSSVTVVIVSIATVFVLDQRRTDIGPDLQDLSVISIVDLTTVRVHDTHFMSGLGSSSKGRVGLSREKGGGSRFESKKAHGGGGSGGLDPLSSQRGAIPQPSEIPARLDVPRSKNPALPAAGINIDPALWRDLPIVEYGDPVSKTNLQSHGAGIGGLFGTGEGSGIGAGAGPGVGPGSDGNTGGRRNEWGSNGPGGSPNQSSLDPNHVFKAAEVTEKARILSKPEPQYTEEARRNQISGTVILRVVFSKTGEVANIRTIHPLPFGLTERAILAAKQIRFMPALRDGRAVSVHMQLEYNFNLY